MLVRCLGTRQISNIECEFRGLVSACFSLDYLQQADSRNARKHHEHSWLTNMKPNRNGFSLFLRFGIS